MDYNSRQKKLLKILESKSLDSILIKKKENISYLTGASIDEAILFVCSGENFLTIKSKNQKEYAKSIEEVSQKNHLKRIGIESDIFSHSKYNSLKKNLKNKTLISLKDAIESLRMVKDKDELRYIKASCKYADQVMNYALENVKPSIKENALKNRIETYLTKRGFKRAGFDIIVASGKNASKPHAKISQKTIKKGDMVVIDLGIVNHGYNSDLTRTCFLGRINRKYSRIYNIVLDAQKKAIERIKPGLSAKYIDNISRQYIINKGLGKYFMHGLGHGIGLQVHEKPRISKNDNTILKKDMVVTIEPGIYIPGWGGVRIEDVVLITKNGSQILTKSSKKLLCK